MRAFFDLEETIIDSFQDGRIVNEEPVKHFIANRGITEISIFSYAIWDDDHKEEFERLMKDSIEQIFNVKIIEVLTAEQIRLVVCKHLSAHFDLHDFLALWGKKRGFVEYAATLPDNHVILLDDCVPNMRIEMLDVGQVIELIDVTKLK